MLYWDGTASDRNHASSPLIDMIVCRLRQLRNSGERSVCQLCPPKGGGRHGSAESFLKDMDIRGRIWGPLAGAGRKFFRTTCRIPASPFVVIVKAGNWPG